MMRTLVIHPQDKSTDFLKPIYSQIPTEDLTVITKGTRDEVEELIKSHDRVIMMGHGCPLGLFSVGQFRGTVGFIVDYETVSLLEEKTGDNIFIWCNADRFVNHFQLKGFYSGMFISEVQEANYCGVRGTNQKTINESNNTFSNILSEFANYPTDLIYENVKKEYSLLGEKNVVAKYNSERLYQRLFNLTDVMKGDRTELIGNRIMCIKMVDDPNPIESGVEGTIVNIDDMRHVMVEWDNGRTLSLIPNVDKFEIITKKNLVVSE